MKRPSHATIVAYLALFTALSGSAYAAATINSANIKDNSIRSRDIRNQTLTGKDINERALQSTPRLYTSTVTAAFPAGVNRVVPIAFCKKGDLGISGASSSGGANALVTSEGPPLGKLVGWSAAVEKTGPNPPSPIGGTLDDPRPSVTAICARKPRR